MLDSNAGKQSPPKRKLNRRILTITIINKYIKITATLKPKTRYHPSICWYSNHLCLLIPGVLSWYWNKTHFLSCIMFKMSKRKIPCYITVCEKLRRTLFLSCLNPNGRGLIMKLGLDHFYYVILVLPGGKCPS